MGEGRAVKPGSDFRRRRAAAKLMGSLKDQRLQTSLGQKTGDNQPVVTPSNDDNVARHAYRPCPRMRRAAFRPGAPMTPPPGWVADPHIHRFRRGVAYFAQPGAGRKKNSCSSVNSP